MIHLAASHNWWKFDLAIFAAEKFIPTAISPLTSSFFKEKHVYYLLSPASLFTREHFFFSSFVKSSFHSSRIFFSLIKGFNFNAMMLENESCPDIYIPPRFIKEPLAGHVLDSVDHGSPSPGLFHLLCLLDITFWDFIACLPSMR